MSEAKFSREYRSECLELVADLLDVCYRGRRPLRPSGADRECGPYRKGWGGDLLFDYVKYQAAQFNQLARLGVAHAEYSRALYQAWSGYGDCAPADAECRVEQVRMGAEHGEPVSAHFV